MHQGTNMSNSLPLTHMSIVINDQAECPVITTIEFNTEKHALENFGFAT